MPHHDSWKWPPADEPVPPVRAATPIGVYRRESSGTFTALPNLVCTSIEVNEGPDPGTAMLRYVMDSRTGGPYTIEQCLGTQFTGPLIIEPGQEICVAAQKPDGTSEWIFDGYPVGFGGNIDQDKESVSIQCTGIAKRIDDATIPGMRMRHADHASDPAYWDEFIDTSIAARFNPGDLKNATPDTFDAGTGEYKYPIFIDPLFGKRVDTDPTPQRAWTLPMACAYLLYTVNAADEFVRSPKRARLDEVLIRYKPKPGIPINPDDPATYDKEDIICPDTPITGKRLSTVIRQLTEDFGFGMRFQLYTGADGDPVTELQLFWRQGIPAKTIYLDARGNDFDGTKNNITQATLERDISSVVNRVIVEGHQQFFEGGFVLANGFPSVAGDAADAQLKRFKNNADNQPGQDDYYKYRNFVFDECGEGHYAKQSTAKLTTIATLDGLLGSGNYVVRRRKPRGQLITADKYKDPLRWTCHISKDYTGPVPGLWNRTGTWQEVSGVTLLKDRLGVRIHVDDPNHWNVGPTTDAAKPFKDGVVKAVQCLAAPDAYNPSFVLLLTCVIEGDQVAKGVAERQDSSPVPWEVDKRVDERDRFKVNVIGQSSMWNGSSPLAEIIQGVDRDETGDDVAKKIDNWAYPIRDAEEAGVFECTVNIPYFTRFYEIGDRIDGIEGRNLGFRTDGGGAGIAPVLPMITSIKWDLAEGQKTVLKLSDHGMDHTQRGKPRTQAAKHARVKPASYKAAIIPKISDEEYSRIVAEGKGAT